MTSPVTSSEGLDAAVRTFPGRYRCGDFAAVVHLDEQRCGVVVLDGGGRGISGLAQSGAIRTAMETAVAVSEDVIADPSTMFNAINQQVGSLVGRQIVPCLFLGIDLPAGRLSYINAGVMPPLLIMGPGRAVTLDQMSLILGVDPHYSYGASQTDLPESFRLVCFTDGLVEATGGSGAFGVKRLQDTLLDCDTYGRAADFVAAVDRAWTTHVGASQATDDATVLVVGRG